MLRIQQLSYRIKDNRILQDLNLSIATSQYYALAGENGAGKSTLIKIVLDLIRNIEQGQISIDGVSHRHRSAKDALVYLPEKFDVKKEVTGWQYLQFVFGVYRQPVNKGQVVELCRQLELDESRLHDKSNTYSKGMKQKLGLISCFMLDKPLIILDEPLSGLDPKARFFFKQLMEAERANRRTIFYSTHMLADAEELCDRFGILHRGRIIFDGTPQQCLQQFSATTLEQAYMECTRAHQSAAGSV